MQYSTLAALQVANKAYRPETTELHGRVRVAVIDTTMAAADKDILLARFPAGRVRILPLSNISTSATGTTTLDVGLGAYHDETFTTVAADPDALLAAKALTDVAKGVSLSGAGASGLCVSSSDGFDLLAAASANLAQGDTLTGVIYYVVD